MKELLAPGVGVDVNGSGVIFSADGFVTRVDVPYSVPRFIAEYDEHRFSRMVQPFEFNLTIPPQLLKPEYRHEAEADPPVKFISLAIPSWDLENFCQAIIVPQSVTAKEPEPELVGV